ncbi:MAG TPA: DUF58 domain-containing protein [Euzebyales bacterium]
MLTARGIALCGVAVAAWALGRFLGVDELYVISGAIVALTALAIVATRVSSARIAVRRTAVARHVHRGERVPVEVALRNDGRLPASLLLVEDRRPDGMAGDDEAARFVVRGLRPRRVAELRWHAVGRRRGRFTIGPVRIRLRDPFGLAERSRRYRSTNEVIVFPAVEPLTAGDAHGMRQGADTSPSQRAFHRGDEFHTMREYVVGDDLRHVHWPSTARRGTLMIRQHELPWQARAVVYVDVRIGVHVGAGDRSTFERAVSVAASVLTHLRRCHYQLHLVTEGAPRTDELEGLDASLVRLAEVTPGRERSPVTAMRAVGDAGEGLLVAVVRPPRRPTGAAGDADDGDAHLADDADLRALQQAGRGYRTRVALIVAHNDTDRCTTMARLLRFAGWQVAVAEPGVALAEVWRRAMVGADIGRLTGARR